MSAPDVIAAEDVQEHLAASGALQQAIARANEARELVLKARGVVEYVEGRLVAKYALSPADSWDESGKITRGENAPA